MTILLTFSWIQVFSSSSLTRWPKGAGLLVWAEWRGVVASLGGLVITDLLFYCRCQGTCWPPGSLCFPSVLLTPALGIPGSPGTGLCIYPSGVPWSCCGFTHQVLSLCTAQGGANLVRRVCVSPQGPLRHPSERVSPRADSQGTLWPLGSFLDVGIFYVEGF